MTTASTIAEVIERQAAAGSRDGNQESTPAETVMGFVILGALGYGGYRLVRRFRARRA